jgi:hypothetical protein
VEKKQIPPLRGFAASVGMTSVWMNGFSLRSDREF